MPESRWVPHLRRCQPNCRGTAGSGEALAPPPSLPPVSLGASSHGATAGATGIFGSGERSSLGERHLSRAAAHFLPPPSLTPRAPSPRTTSSGTRGFCGPGAYLRLRRTRAGGRSGVLVPNLCVEGVTIRSKALPFDLTVHKAQSDDVDRMDSLQKRLGQIHFFSLSQY